MEEFSDKDLENIIRAELFYPDDTEKRLEAMKYKNDFLKSLSATEDQIDDCDLCPETYWYAACELAVQLAETLLHERHDRDNAEWDSLKTIRYELEQLEKKFLL